MLLCVTYLLYSTQAQLPENIHTYIPFFVEQDEPVDLRDGFVSVATPDREVSENARMGVTAAVSEQVLATNAPAALVNGRVEVHIFHHSHGTAIIESLQRSVKSLQEAIRGQQVDTMKDMRKKRLHSNSDSSARNAKK